MPFSPQKSQDFLRMDAAPRAQEENPGLPKLKGMFRELWRTDQK